MSGGRMRRVDEAVREVLSGAITQELKDPRVGFVTVTAVETSPDLRHARVFVSVLGDDARARERSLDGLRSAHGYLQRRVADELRLKHTPTLDFVYDDSRRPLAADPGAARAGGRADVSAPTAPRRRARADARRAARRTSASCSPRTRTPTATRSARSPACSSCSPRSARTRSPTWPPTSSRCPTSTASSQVEDLVTEPPADLERAHDRVPRLRQHRPQPGRRAQARRRAHPQHRPPPRQHAASGRSTTSCPRRRARRR